MNLFLNDISFMAFPLNAILFLLWIVSLFLLWRTASRSGIVRFLLNNKTVCISISLFIASCLLIGFSGRRDLAVSWPFILVLLFFQTVLAMVIFRGWRRPHASGRPVDSVRWRFLLLHAGLFIAVASAFWGAPDTQTYRVRLHPDSVNLQSDTPTEAYRMDGSRVWMDCTMSLLDFKFETSDNGVPLTYDASVMIDGEQVDLRVNHPYSRRFGEDIYLTGYDDVSGVCILQVVYEPWKYTALIGIIMMLAGAFLLFLRGPQNKRES